MKKLPEISIPLNEDIPTDTLRSVQVEKANPIKLKWDTTLSQEMICLR